MGKSVLIQSAETLEIGTKVKEKLIPEYIRSQSPTLIRWSLIGYLIRLLFTPITTQSDLINNGFQSTILYSQGYWLPTTDSPLYFYLQAGWLKLFSHFMPFGIFWDIPSKINFGTDSNQWLIALLLRLSDPHVYPFLFISKVLYLIPDFIVAIALLHLFSKQSEGLSAFKFWMINPVTIFVTYVIGQFDIFVAVFLTLALLAVYKRKYLYGITFLGLGAAFKISLLLLIPLILLNLACEKRLITRFRKLAEGIMLSVLPVILSYLSVNLVPVHTASYDLTHYTPKFSFFGLFLNRTITFATGSGFNDYFFAFVFFYFFFIILYYLKGDYSYDSFWKISFAVFLFYFALSFFHAQWFLWVQPLIVIGVAKYRKLLTLYIAGLIGFAGYLMYFDKAITIDLLLPINSGIASLPGPIELMTNAGLPPSMVIGIFRTLLSTCCIGMVLFVLWNHFLQRTNINQPSEE